MNRLLQPRLLDAPWPLGDACPAEAVPLDPDAVRALLAACRSEGLRLVWVQRDGGAWACWSQSGVEHGLQGLEAALVQRPGCGGLRSEILFHDATGRVEAALRAASCEQGCEPLAWRVHLVVAVSRSAH